MEIRHSKKRRAASPVLQKHHEECEREENSMRERDNVKVSSISAVSA